MNVPFSTIQNAVATRFRKMSRMPLFRVDVDKDKLWDLYLNSFPAGTNEIFRKRREYDCSCCKQFIRAVGDVVFIDENYDIRSLWEVGAEGQFIPVMAAMDAYVRSAKIVEPFYIAQDVMSGNCVGKSTTRSMFEGNIETFDHFSVEMPRAFVMSGKDIGPRISDHVATHGVFSRGLSELSTASLDIILELIAQDSLYRGASYRDTVELFRELKIEFGEAGVSSDIFAWKHSHIDRSDVMRFKNTAIGTLAEDLSNDVPIDKAVASFESKVAPQNYKRTSAPVTSGMIRKAQEKVEELGLTAALERRFATKEDITVNNVLFIDRAVKPRTSNVFETLERETPKSVGSFSKVEEVPVERFLNDILPKATKLEVFLENRHKGNLVSLMAPIHSDAGSLFPWSNNFSWAYAGDVADSIKEKVKNYGGNVEGVMRFSLSWNNTDDLDAHCIEPSGYEIYYDNKGHASPCKGKLDIDMNARGTGMRTDPVENIIYNRETRLEEGIYSFVVHQFERRNNTNYGFSAELELDGVIHSFEYPDMVRQDQKIKVASVRYSKKDGFHIVNSMESKIVSTSLWGLASNNFHEVEMLINSPNFWDGQGVGNKHMFFMLKNCKNPDKARGFFNEHLRSDLLPHRKVFEILGAKTMSEPTDTQVSGLGFSETVRNSLILKVSGSYTRTIKVIF